MLVLDDLHTLFSRSVQVKAAAKQFIERYLGANDIAAVVTTGGSRAGAQEFTSSKRLLLRAVDGFAGQQAAIGHAREDRRLQSAAEHGHRRSAEDISEPERAHNARNAMSTLQSVSDYLAGVRGRRKAIVFFSEGIDYDVTNPIQNQYADRHPRSDATGHRRGEPGQRQLLRRRRARSGRPRRRGDSDVEPAAGNSLGTNTLQDELRLSQDSLRIISDETGGFAAVNQNDFPDRVLAHRSGQQQLLRARLLLERRASGRPIQERGVRVNKPGLRVRARKGYIGPKGKPKDAAPANAKTSPALREALDSPVPVSGLGLTVFASPFKGAEPNASVAVTLEVDGTNLKFSNQNNVFADDVEIAIVAIDQTAKIKDGGTM